MNLTSPFAAVALPGAALAAPGQPSDPLSQVVAIGFRNRPSGCTASTLPVTHNMLKMSYMRKRRRRGLKGFLLTGYASRERIFSVLGKEVVQDNGK